MSCDDEKLNGIVIKVHLCKSFPSTFQETRNSRAKYLVSSDTPQLFRYKWQKTHRFKTDFDRDNHDVYIYTVTYKCLLKYAVCLK